MRSDDFRPRDYPVEDDIAFQRKLWKLERVGWPAQAALERMEQIKYAILERNGKISIMPSR